MVVHYRGDIRSYATACQGSVDTPHKIAYVGLAELSARVKIPIWLNSDSTVDLRIKIKQKQRICLQQHNKMVIAICEAIID
ncbi:MAG: hypothetical protein KGL58_00800 [Pseudomonadota bacterium]|nr:hypothetical protein [Pseudomonadota bacterium]